MGIGAAVAAGLVDVGMSATIAAVVGPALVGAASGALISGVTGGDPLKGALMGGAGGALGGIAGQAFNSLAGATTAADTGSAIDAGSALAPAAAESAGGNVLDATTMDATGNAVDIGAEAAGAGPAAATAADTSGSSWWSNLNPLGGNFLGSNSAGTNYVNSSPDQQVAQDIQNAGGTDSSGSDVITGSAPSLFGPGASSSSGSSSSGAGLLSGKGGINGTSLALGALAAGAQMLSKPKSQPNYNITPTAANTSNNTMFNAPMPTSGYVQQTPVPNYTPATGNWYTYGQRPEPAFFSPNQLTLARGGALRAIPRPGMAHGNTFNTANGDNYVKGDGDGTSDDVNAHLSRGEYVLTASDVSRIGQGSNDAGAERLDQFRDHLAKESGQRKFIPAKTRGALSHLARRRRARAA